MFGEIKFRAELAFESQLLQTRLWVTHQRRLDSDSRLNWASLQLNCVRQQSWTHYWFGLKIGLKYKTSGKLFEARKHWESQEGRDLSEWALRRGVYWCVWQSSTASCAGTWLQCCSPLLRAVLTRALVVLIYSDCALRERLVFGIHQ